VSRHTPEGNRRYCKQYRVDRERNGPRRVPAGPAADLVRQLIAEGYSRTQIAAATGCSRSEIDDLANGRPTVHRDIAARILQTQIRADRLPAQSSIDATGTRRRLQALMVASWPQHHLAARLGTTDATVRNLLQSPQVTVAKARAVRALYDELWRAAPADHGIDAQARSRARNHALRSGWAPVGAWDDDTIDDPGAQPDWTGHCGTRRGAQAHHEQGTPVCPRCQAAAPAKGAAA